MTATTAMVNALAAPTPKADIKYRPAGKNGGFAVSYIDARFVMSRLDETVGPESWQTKYEDVPGGVRCLLGIDIEGIGWVWKSDASPWTDREPLKGGHSKALVRAAVHWGIARDLYEPEDDAEHSTSPTGNGRSSRPSVTAGRGEPPSSRPAPSTGDTAEPEWLREIDGGGGEDCPVHHKPFKYNSRGGYCPTKVGDGWCQEKPRAAVR